ncbi:MAG TPA: dihydrolipoamide acetyltransferase family protein [Phycisphaerae bacterium]|nr:2-oxo acid dehydrogenase subunit E2 [Phycisphaerales bacterium]HRX83716.1 dihydrolipoamide acetyltransferase family protein [Phycisphaerae bacterium]
MASEFKLPDLGEGITEGQIVRILVAEGDEVAEDQAILEVETDKAAVEIPSPVAGVASKIHVKEGETVAVGQTLVTFDGDGGADEKPAKAEKPAKKSESSGKSAKQQAPQVEEPERKRTKAQPADDDDDDAAAARKTKATPEPPARDVDESTPGGPQRTRAAAAPAVRKFARENGVDIDALTGSGPGGRVLQSDVEAAIGGAPAPGRPSAPARVPAPPAVTFGKLEGQVDKDNWGKIKRQSLSQIRKTIARQMVKSVSTIPHVTQTDDADVTVLEELRAGLKARGEGGPRITSMAFLLRTLAHCLREHPVFNATFDSEAEQIVYKEYINIGIAVDSPRGLVVPVMRNVDQLSITGIAQELGRVAQKVRNVDFTIDELRGGTFTVTNYGAIGGVYGTPVINHPEVAILGVGRTQERLALDGDRVVRRKILPLSLSFDHRATDGAQAARFLNDVVTYLSNPALLLVQ